jgi:chaperonin GroEL
MDIKRSLDEASIKVVSEIKKVSRPLRGDELLQVATISAENKEIGQIIVDTLDAIGKDGIISVEESKGQYVESKIVEGYEMPKGFVSPFMINRDGNKSEYLNCKVLVVGDKLSTVAEILPFFQKVSEATKDLVIFCPDIDPIVTATFVHNKQTGMFNTLVVQIPSLKDEVLEDIAIVTGAKFVSKASGFDFATLEPSCLGSAERVTATHAKTIIINGGGSVKKKTKDLKTHLATITDDNEYDLCEKRIARLNGGVAVISVGAKTEQEMRYLFYKVEDAVNATRAAIEEGIVEGGGMTLYRISQKLGDTVGDRILAKALRVPLRYILENGGLDYTEVLLNMPKGKGFNAHTREYENLIETGVIDPAKVERCCVENAVSFAGPFLTSFATVALDRSGKDKLE